MSFLIDLLVKVLDGLPNDVVKKAIDKALDPIEDWLNKDGLTVWEKLAMATIQLIRKGLQITEEAGSDYED